MRALRDARALESAREDSEHAPEARRQRRELERAKYEADLARYHRMRDANSEPTAGADRREESTRDALLGRRLLLPDLAGVSFGTGALGAGAFVGVVGTAGMVNLWAASGNRGGLNFGFAPRADVRVGDRFTVGGSLAFARSSFATGQGDSTMTTVAVSPRVGVLVPAGSFVLWPRFGVSVAAGGDDFGSVATSLGVNLDLAVVFPLTSHVFLQMAPSLAYRRQWVASAGTDLVTFGVQSGVGLAF
jgi:hypothetical protein